MKKSSVFKKDTDQDKSVEFNIRKSEDNKFDNDPINYEKNEKQLETDEERVKKKTDMLEFGFKYTLSDICCGCLNKDTITKKKKYFDTANSVLLYYMDIITYIKKMIEIDIIKNYLFNKDEVRLISFISNPDFADADQAQVVKMIESEYQEAKFKKLYIENTLKNVLEKARNNSETNKLLYLVQKGNRKLIDTES